jgi:hypothetical protein
MGFHVTGSSFRARPMFSPHPHCLPRHLGSLLHHRHTDTTRTPRPTGSRRFPTTQRTGAPHTTWTVFVATQHPPTIRPVPWRIRPSLVSVLRRSPTPDGPTACLTPTHRTRQRISRHSPFPTSHDALTSREETICLSPFLSTRAPADATTSHAWSSRHILRSFGLTVPHAHPETIGLLSRGARSPAIYAPQNTS